MLFAFTKSPPHTCKGKGSSQEVRKEAIREAIREGLFTDLESSATGGVHRREGRAYHEECEDDRPDNGRTPLVRHRRTDEHDDRLGAQGHERDNGEEDAELLNGRREAHERIPAR